MNYYEILGISKEASKEEIKKSYKSLALKYHPDKLKDDATEEDKQRFLKIQEAYEVLSDESKRNKYDNGSLNFDNDDVDDDSLFEFFKAHHPFNNMFNNMFNNSQTDIINVDVIVDLQCIIFGSKQEIVFDRKSLADKNGNIINDMNGIDVSKIFNKCNKCNGKGRIMKQHNIPTGIMQQISECQDCNGKGKSLNDDYTLISEPCTININIPIGIFHGRTFTMNNVGNINLSDIHQRNDIVLKIIVTCPDKFNIDLRNNLIYTYDISVFDILIEKTLEFVHPNGKKYNVEVSNKTIPIISYENQGLPYIDLMSTLFIKFNILYPTLTYDDKQLMTNIAKRYKID